MLLILGLVVVGKLSFLLFNVVPEESALVLRARDFLSDPLHLDVFLVEIGFGIHDVAVDGVALLTQVDVSSLHIFKLGLKDLLISRLLLDLFFIVLAQVANAVLEHGLSGCDLLNSHLELLIH